MMRAVVTIIATGTPQQTLLKMTTILPKWEILDVHGMEITIATWDSQPTKRAVFVVAVNGQLRFPQLQAPLT